MQTHITRPVVIASAAGFKYLAPGLVVELPDTEADQVKRQNAGSVIAEDAAEAEAEPEASKTCRKKQKNKENDTSAADNEPLTES